MRAHRHCRGQPPAGVAQLPHPRHSLRVIPEFYSLSVVFPGGVLLLTLAFALPVWRRARASSRWSATSGRILSSVVTSPPPGTRWSSIRLPDVRYQYDVAGTSYVGATVRFSFSNSRPDETVARYPPGRHVTVYFDPDAPAQCVLEPGLPPGDVRRASYPLLLVVSLFAAMWVAHFFVASPPTPAIEKAVVSDGDIGSSAPQCKAARTTVEMEDCLQHEPRVDEGKLSTLETRVRGQLAQVALGSFDSAAIAWRSYRDRECKGVYLANSAGSIAAMSSVGCKLELTDGRLHLLGRLYVIDK
jgi:uncharacterized protein YecT (DUF1311 family)